MPKKGKSKHEWLKDCYVLCVLHWTGICFRMSLVVYENVNNNECDDSTFHSKTCAANCSIIGRQMTKRGTVLKKGGKHVKSFAKKGWG